MNTQTTDGNTQASSETPWDVDNRTLWEDNELKPRNMQQFWLATCRLYLGLQDPNRYKTKISKELEENFKEIANGLPREISLSTWANRVCEFKLEHVMRGDKRGLVPESMTMIEAGLIMYKTAIQIEGYIPQLFAWYDKTIEGQTSRICALIDEIHNLGGFKACGITTDRELEPRYNK